MFTVLGPRSGHTTLISTLIEKKNGIRSSRIDLCDKASSADRGARHNFLSWDRTGGLEPRKIIIYDVVNLCGAGSESKGSDSEISNETKATSY